MEVRSSGSNVTSATVTRLRREDFRRTKHDSAFSQWKILIGASDWEDHSMGKEGVERYRTQNLPNGTSCPGVYELGIATSRPQSGRETRNLDSSYVIPVYLGQSDNLRNRMQQYGRDGDHLENGCTSIKIYNGQRASARKGPELFTDIFSRGLPIVYRCAPMNSKKDAEITEKELLDKFDYAWNKGSNGLRRQDDIHKKLERLEKASKFSLLAKNFLFSNQREVGIKIRTGSNVSEMDNNTIFSRIVGVRRLQARPVQYGSSDCGNNICGVAIGHGSVCTTPPVAGRKRCAMHKGQRVNGSNVSEMDNNTIFSRIVGVQRLQARPVQYGSSDCGNNICGVAIGHGSVCATPPVAGRKRCAMHKGQRVNGYISKLNTEGKAAPPDVETDEIQQFSDKDFNLHCGFILEDGSSCKSSPFRGNKRCLEHKGKRIPRSNLRLQGKNPEKFMHAQM